MAEMSREQIEALKEAAHHGLVFWRHMKSDAFEALCDLALRSLEARPDAGEACQKCGYGPCHSAAGEASCTFRLPIMFKYWRDRFADIVEDADLLLANIPEGQRGGVGGIRAVAEQQRDSMDAYLALPSHDQRPAHFAGVPGCSFPKCDCDTAAGNGYCPKERKPTERAGCAVCGATLPFARCGVKGCRHV